MKKSLRFIVKSILILCFLTLHSNLFSQEMDCTNIQDWDPAKTYATNGTMVKYDLKVYKNKWWTKGDIPGTQWGPWEFVANCGAVLIPPTCDLTAPANGTVYTQGDVLTLAADASDTDGTVTQVEFFVGSISVGVDLVSPYTVDWTSNISGSFNITAVATDNDNKSTTSTARAITLKPFGNNIAPTVELTSPANNANFTVGETVNICVNAEDVDGQITCVEFLSGSTVIGTDCTAPYCISWILDSTAIGTHAISAIATDDSNASATSSVRNITVEGNVGNQLYLSSLPLQINLNQGVSKVYKYDATIASILTRNKGIVDVQVSGDQMTITGVKAGRTGLRINTATSSYFMGVRVNHPDGSMPYLPKHVAIGSVSEDSQADLEFWKDVDIDLTNKEMDIRYIYINGGPINGWRSWNPARVTNFATESMRFGLIPFFVYYNIPDDAEDFNRDLQHIQDPTYMTAYFEDLNIFLDQAQDVLQGELYGIVLEPDFLGYMQQQAEAALGSNDPNTIPTSVSATTIAANAGTVTTLVERINSTIDSRRAQGHSIFFGWQLNLWAYAPTSGPRGVLRRTDDNDLGFTAGRAAIKEAGEQTTLYAMNAGILSNGANFISIDKYGLDAGISNPQDPFNSTWFFNNDHWNNYLYYVKNMNLTSGMPIVLWQLPVGHINSSTMVSAYTGTTFADLPNTSTKYEDSTTDFFFGDTFNPGARAAYFSENKWNDPKLTTSGGQVTWGNHFQETKDAGVIITLFGAGVGASTDGIGNPPTDDYFWIQKAQTYYANGPVPLSKEYGPDDVYGGTANKRPTATITNPAADTSILVNTGITIKASASDQDGTVAQVEFQANGVSIGIDNTSPYEVNWSEAVAGTYTITAIASDDKGATGISEARTINVVTETPVLTTINISPSPATVNTNKTQQFSAQGLDQNGNPIAATYVWSATGGTIDANGLYTAGATVGNYTVTATSGTVTSSASVTVTDVVQPDYNIIMYVTSWSGSAAAYDYSKVTHINYSFAIPNADGTIPGPDNPSKLQDVVTRAHAAGVKVSLAIGGWLNSSPSNTPFETFSQTAQGRANFANACVNLIQQYNLDGIDIDWEYPVQQDRWDNLITDLRQAIGPDVLLTAAVAGSSYFGQGFGTTSFGDLDWINIMSYDMNGVGTGGTYQFFVDGLNYWTGRGMPINKCVGGVPFYPLDNEPALHTQKANYIKSVGAAGMMAWELADDTDGSQLGAIYDVLGGTSGSAPVANANGPYNAQLNAVINFSSAGSSDIDGTIVSYAWNFGDGGTSTAANPTHAYSAVGTYNVTLTVTDNDGKTGTNSTSAVITDTNFVPVLTSVVVTPDAATVLINTTEQYSAQGYDQNNNPMNATFSWSATGGTIDANGLYTAGATAGSYSVTATSGAVSGSAPVTVTADACPYPIYIENGGYTEGSRVTCDGIVYECKPHPYSGWCNGQAWAYSPCSGLYWQDAWTELGPCATVKSAGAISELISGNDIKVYPNPFSGKATIQLILADEANATISIYNASGQQVVSLTEKSLAKGEHRVQFDGSELPSGLYLYKIQINNDVYTGNLLKK